jgi:HAD superfamily hydrolase (TIGR01509 family)
MKYKGIIFDFNGVLLWDRHLHEQAWRQFSTVVRGAPLSQEEMALHVHGRSNRDILTYLAGHSLPDTDIERLSYQKEAIYQQLCKAEGESFSLSPGAVELLEFLVAHHVPHTIATASGKENVDFYAEHLHLGRWFELKQIVYDNGSQLGKPAPDMYREAASRLGLPPADCIVVEDSLSGIRAAQAAGIGHIVALGPDHTRGEPARIEGVSEVLENLRQFHQEIFFLAK